MEFGNRLELTIRPSAPPSAATPPPFRTHSAPRTSPLRVPSAPPSGAWLARRAATGVEWVPETAPSGQALPRVASRARSMGDEAYDNLCLAAPPAGAIGSYDPPVDGTSRRPFQDLRREATALPGQACSRQWSIRFPVRGPGRTDEAFEMERAQGGAGPERALPGRSRSDPDGRILRVFGGA